MKRIRGTILICVMSVLGLGTTGAIVTLRTISMYDGICSEVKGFPALLMPAGFIEKGECRERVEDENGPNKERFCEAEPCRTSNNKKGRCAKKLLNKKVTCFCKAIGPTK